MIATSIRTLVLAALFPLVAVPSFRQDDASTLAKIPDPGVPEVMAMDGLYVRTAYNDEGYATLAYEFANNSVGDPWMLLDAGIALGKVRKDQKITRDAVSLSTPDGQTVPLLSNAEYVSANLRAAEYRVLHVELEFPAGTYARSCPDRDGSRFFYDSAATQYATVYPPLDGVKLNPQCRWQGTLYFPVPGGIQYGHYFLNVKFDGSLIRVPFRIMTKDEAKMLDKNYKSIKEQVRKAYGPKEK
jgi:hypothetical protein